MSSPPGRIRATDLHDLALCPHRVHLERRLGPDQRDPPSAARQRLMRRGLDFERQVAETLGWPQPVYPPGDFEAGARATLELMRARVPGIYQGVVQDGRRLAVPDLLERTPGASELGDHHYRPGDIKAGLVPQAHQALQVGFSALLLEAAQGRLPETGFLVMGDSRRVELPLDRLLPATREVLSRVQRIIDGRETTSPFLCPACGTCPWRGRCLPDLVERADLSLVDGMTPTRRRLLEARGVRSLDALARLEPGTGDPRRPPLDLERLVPQARALCEGRVELSRPLELPEVEGGLLLEAERDPLQAGAVLTLAWRSLDAAPASGTVRLLTSPDECRAAAGALEQAARNNGGRLFHFGGAAPAALARLGDEAGLEPAALEALSRRLWDLRSTLRRGAAWLPVWRYRREQVAAALRGRPLPWPGEGSDTFLLAETLREGEDPALREAIEARCRSDLDQLAAILGWILAQPHRPPRRPR
ncbi:MAG: TM0106 family RecB-like putative nuclease [Acidobacteriota bacterium]|nr:TM0106 family RecB-like putative nuclease [Acidobacteriota bacterium]